MNIEHDRLLTYTTTFTAGVVSGYFLSRLTTSRDQVASSHIVYDIHMDQNTAMTTMIVSVIGCLGWICYLS
jgi:hypothetical protein